MKNIFISELLRSISKKLFVANQGFTLIELIMSTGILLVLIGMMTGIFGSVIDASLDSQSTSGIDQDSRYIIARLVYDMQRSSQIVAPTTPGSGTNPSLTLKINSIDYTYSLNAGGNLQISDGTETNVLNGNTTRVDSVTFQRLGIGDSTDTIQVKFNLTSRIQESSGVETKSYQTTIGMQ